MISIKTPQQIKLMAESGRILAEIIAQMAEMARPGITTKTIDDFARQLCRDYKVKPAFLGYEVAGSKYPAVSCLSVNDAIVHAIPDDRPLQDGDVLGIDMGVNYRGWNSDAAVTIIVGSVSPPSPSYDKRGTEGAILASKLITVTRDSMCLGIEQAKVGNHVGDIGHAVQTYVEKHGFGVVRELVGHGIGKTVHEEPKIPNFGKAGEGSVLREGMVICIEPMVTVGDWHLMVDKDGWAYRTKDGSLSAHFEHTIAITKNGPHILTKI